MKTLEIRTIFAQYYLTLVKQGQAFFAHGYPLNLERVKKVDVVYIIDANSGLDNIVIEAKVGSNTHEAEESRRGEYEILLKDRVEWMVKNGYEKILNKHLPEEKYKRGDASEMINKERRGGRGGRVLIDMIGAKIVNKKARFNKKSMKQEQYFEI